MVNVSGKWALITGASRGVGYQTALFMAKQGCNLILHSRSLEHSSKVEEEVKALGVKAYSVQAELANNDEVVAMLDEIEAKGTSVDIVFNNAAVQIAYREDYWNTPTEDFEMSFRINFISIATICNRLIPKMIERGFGRVINTTSGIKNEPEQAGYAASKAALDKFTKDLANIGIATLFRYFPKKEKLIVAVATKLLEPTLQRFADIADLPLSCLDKLSHLFDYFIEDHNNPSTKLMSDFESYAAHTSDPLEGMDEFKELHQRIADEFSKIIHAGIQDGSIRTDLSIEETLPTVINAFGLFSKKLSLKAHFLLLDSDLESSRQLEILKNMLINYLKA